MRWSGPWWCCPGPGDLFIFVSNSSGPDHGPVCRPILIISGLWWRSPGSRHHFQIPKLAIHWTYFVTLKFNALSPVSAQLLEGLSFENWTSLISFNWTKSFRFIRGCCNSQVPKVQVDLGKSFMGDTAEYLMSLMYHSGNAIVLTPPLQVPWQHNLSFVGEKRFYIPEFLFMIISNYQIPHIHPNKTYFWQLKFSKGGGCPGTHLLGWSPNVMLALLNLFVSARPSVWAVVTAIQQQVVASVNWVCLVNITHTERSICHSLSELETERGEPERNIREEGVNFSVDNDHYRPHRQHVMMVCMRPGWYLCPASPSVLKVAQRSSPSDPWVLLSATCWSVSITCWGSQTETSGPGDTSNWHSPLPLFSWLGPCLTHKK